MDVEVELEEGPDIADNPAENLTLKARVEAASGLEMADKLPSALYAQWLVFAEARAPFLQASLACSWPSCALRPPLLRRTNTTFFPDGH